MIVKAHISDAKKLTEIALKSKAFWGYSNTQIESWRDDLTITQKMFDEWTIYKYLINKDIVGFYILNRVNIRTSILEFLFISPKFIKQGLGKKLLLHAIEKCKKESCVIINVLSDPNAEAFYAKHGFKIIAQIESSVPGRFLPEMEFEIEENI
ncbi:GNAT family N-acetyltransferase [Polaribacter sp. Z022]|uniref:GNAT family N-acetyltransferase n=1 Tax=Polaribacter sp. Z022 TaxID=2927125 RepID=UPI0020202D61|nr:GNAT family N-acetyltransferase [Polaribacter sp. Z022]MCL7754493.1 GNAT family N-acetyltransferase [Polaribacter sp. Z022]